MDELKELSEDPGAAAARLGRGRPDVECGVRALALGELLAAGAGFAGTLPDAVAKHATTAPAGVMRDVLARVRAVRQDSDLRDLWDESGKVEPWLAVVDGLIRRLSASIEAADDAATEVAVEVESAKDLRRLIRQLAGLTGVLANLSIEIDWDDEEMSVVLEADDEEVEATLHIEELATGLADLLNELLELLEASAAFEGDDDRGIVLFSIEED